MNLFKSTFGLIILVSQIFIVSAFGISAKFTVIKKSNCAPALVEFTNTSTSGTGITYKWNFGLGAIITTTSNSLKSQLYTTPGQYKITLIATNGVDTDSTSAIIIIAKGPKADFTAVPASGCSPLLVNYTSSSAPGDSAIATTEWDFRNGDFLSGNAVQYTYRKSGRYNIALKVTDKNGCSNFLESDSIIQVMKKPVANFATLDTFACTPPLNVSFVNLSSGTTNLTYKWEYGNGLTSTEISNSTLYNSMGSFDVKLTATDLNGCSDSLVKKSHIVIGSPQGTLSVYDSNNNPVDKSTLCSGTYKFVFSIGNLSDYTWLINDNNKVTTINGNSTLTYLVKDTGILEVTLIYGKNGFCTENIQRTFGKSAIKAEFTIDDSLFCSLPHKVKLQNNSKDATSYSWYLFDRLIADKTDTDYTITQSDIPQETYKRLYSHETDAVRIPFTLVATNKEGCTDVFTRETVVSFPVARFMPDKVSGCAPLQVSLSDSSKSSFKIDGYTYKIGAETISVLDKTPVKYTFTTPGEYYVTEIINSSGCLDTSYAVKIVVGEKLKPNFTVTPAEVCNGGGIHIVAASNNNSAVGLWHLKSANIFDLSFASRPDTTITVISDSLGFKNIRLHVDYNGCISDTTKKSVYKVIGSVGNFQETFSCDSALTYHFKSGMLPATSLTWNVDTAIFKDIESVRYKFPAGGNYTVKLTAIDGASSCSFTRTKLIKVRQIKANFTLNDSVFCAGDSVLMNATSSVDYINSCYNEGFLWDFGDDSPPRRTYLPTFDHVYTARGKYILNLIATAENGCVDSAKKNIFVYRPAGSFTTDKKFGCMPAMDVKFENTSTDSTIVKWIWDFGDDVTNNTNIKKLAHSYTSVKPVTFNATLSVFDEHQCFSSLSVPITLVGINGEFQANDNAICVGQTVKFTPEDTSLDSIFWNFGDGNTSKTQNSNTYNNQGKYSISLTAYKDGCSNTMTKPNYVIAEKADAQFVVNDSIFNCYPDTIIVQHKNLNGSPLINRTWTFDAKESNNTTNSAMFIYTRPGNYTAQLRVKTLNGCAASSSKNILVNGPTAAASFSPSEICYNETVNFQIDSMKNVSSFKWIFGDGTTSTVSPAVHNYTAQGYIVPAIQLINNKCTVSKSLDTLFVSYQNLKFTRVPLRDTTVNFGDSIRLTILADASNLNYVWSPDYNISCLTCDNPMVKPLKDFTYTVGMKDKCYDITEDFKIKVIADFYLEAPSAFTPNGDLSNDIFKFEAKNIATIDLKVFNRWGKIVFSTNDTSEGWDGTVNGKAQNADTYTYYIKAETITGHKFEKNGSFLLLK